MRLFKLSTKEIIQQLDNTAITRLPASLHNIDLATLRIKVIDPESGVISHLNDRHYSKKDKKK